MSLCRVDTDRLRGLASQLGSTAVALGDAASAANLLATNGYASAARRVAATLGDRIDFVTRWQVSLDERAAVLDREHHVFGTPTFVSAQQLRNVEIGVELATHSTSAARLASTLDRREDLDDAIAAVERLVSARAPAAAIAACFAGIDSDLAATIAAARPETIGGLAGVPLRFRFLANRVLVSRARAAAHRALRAGVENPRSLLTQLATLDELDDGTRRFVLFDWDQQRIVEWLGPEDAAHVAVYLPGAGIGGAEYPGLAAKLERLVHLDGAGGALAIVAALAYTPPPTIAHAALGRYADTAGPEIVALLDGMGLAGRHVSLVGHSYGAVVLGEALRVGAAGSLPADLDVVAMGAPGMRADHVSDLGIAPDRFWAARLAGDEIVGALHPAALPHLAACTMTGLSRILPSCAGSDRLLHGVDPASPAFGGSVLQVESTRDHGAGHADYLAVRIVAGEPQPSPMVRTLIRILVGRVPAGG